MKQFFKSLWTVAALATVFAGCSKDEAESPANKPREISMSVIAGSELESSPASRTTLNDDNSISWETSGEFLRVFETVGTETNSRKSEEALIDAGKAVFNVSFTENTSATSFTYNAVYPESAWVDGNTDVNNMRLITPTNQLPTATSFDGDADLLIAYPEQRDAQPTELQVRFKRIVAVGKMTIKNLNTTESITSVEFIAPESKKVTGRSYVNLNEGTVTQYGYTNNAYNNVVMNYDASLEMQSGMTAYFTCFPFEILAGETFKVVVTTPSKIFTREVTIPDERSLAFTEGHASVFSVDMSTATEEEIASSEIEDGDYVIMAYYTKDNIAGYYALSSVADGSRLADVNVSYDNSGSINSNDDNIVWTIAQDVDSHYYTITNGPENYLKYASKGASTSSSVNYFLVEKQEDGTYTIDAKDNPDYGLRYNANSGFFAFYNSAPNVSMIGNFYIVPVSSKTALETPTNVEAVAEGNEVLVGWKPVAGATSYTVSFEPATIEPRTVLHDDATAEYSEIFENLDYATEYTVSVVANPADTENYKASAPATATFTTGENPNVTYTQIKDLVKGETVAIKDALVVATSTRGPILWDETGAILAYQPSETPAIGSVVTVNATVGEYNKALQLNDATFTVTGTTEVPTQTATEVTAANIDDLMTVESVTATYVKFTGTLNISGYYYNVVFPFETNYQGSLYYPDAEALGLAALNGRKVIVEGWFTSISGSRYLNVVATKVSSASEAPYITADETASFVAAGETKTINFMTDNLGENQVLATISGDGAGQFSVGQIGAEFVTVTAIENTETTAKTATLTLYIAASEGGEHLAEAIVTLTQSAKSSGSETGTTITMTYSDIISGGSSSLPTNSYGSQNVNNESTYYTWAFSSLDFAGSRICIASSEDYAGLIQIQGNASDVSKQGFFGNVTDLGKITKIVVVSVNTSYEPSINLYMGTEKYPTTNLQNHPVYTQDGNVYTEEYVITGDYGYFRLWNDSKGATYIQSISITYEN